MIERTSGYDNKAMWEYCETLKNVVTQTKEVKSGRGKAVEIRKVLKYNTDMQTVANIIDSAKHYKESYEAEQKSKVILRDYQVDIVNKGYKIISQYRFLYLAMEVRTGKTQYSGNSKR